MGLTWILTRQMNMAGGGSDCTQEEKQHHCRKEKLRPSATLRHSVHSLRLFRHNVSDVNMPQVAALIRELLKHAAREDSQFEIHSGSMRL